MKSHVVPRKKFFRICAFTLVLFFGIFIGINIAANMVSAKNNRLVPIYSVNTNEKKIALTFDAAWGNSDIDKITDVLQKYNAKSTFFCTGDWVERYPEDTTALFNKGHEIQNHSDNHPHVASIDTEELLTDTNAASEKIKKAINIAPSLYRAPYGEYSNEMMTALQQNLKLRVIQWDVDSRDWQEGITLEKIISNVTDTAKPGSIVLFHVDAKPKYTAEALEIILKNLSSDGYSFVTVNELIFPLNQSATDRNGVLHHRCATDCTKERCTCTNCPEDMCRKVNSD